MNIYVDCNAKKSGDGSKKLPFSTIAEAKDYIKTASSCGKYTVYIRGGRYFFKETLCFTDEDFSCKYKAYDGEKVYFDGGIVLSQDEINKLEDAKIKEKIIEESARDKIYTIDLKKYNITLAKYGNRGFRRPYIPAPNELFVNSIPYAISSYPKGNEYIPLTKVIDSGSVFRNEEFDCRGGIIGYDIARTDKWKDAKDAYLSGFFGACYADDTVKIDFINTEEKTIKTIGPTLCGFHSKPEHRWKILNLLEEISEPGEYYIDRENKMLYFYPECNTKDMFVQISVLENPILSFINAQNIRFEGIVFENSRGSGVYIEGGENIEIRNSTFRNLGTVAVQIGKGISPLPDGLTNCHGKYDHEKIKPYPISEQIGSWHEYIYEYPAFDGNGGKNHEISGCEIYNIGAGGVILGGGNRKNLIPANNAVANCHIYNVNRLDKTYKGAVNIWGVGNIISHCELENLDGFAVYIHGNDHLIEYNKIHNVAKIISDGAAIYMGRDPSEVGNKIRYNFIYDIKNPHSYDMYGFTAIYFDDYAIYNEVYGNYFYDIVQKGQFFFSTIHWNCGGQTSVANNVFIDCYPGPDPNSYDNAYELMHNDEVYMKRVHTTDEKDLSGVDVTSEVWKEKYPYLYDTYMNNYHHRNVYYNNFICCNQYHNFVDENPSHLNFKFKKDSYMLSKYATGVYDRVRNINNEKVYFENIDFDKIGLIKK